jgi:hypothetical protein
MLDMPRPTRFSPTLVTAVPTSLQRIRALRDLQERLAGTQDRLTLSRDTLSAGESVLREARERLHALYRQWAAPDAP